MCAEIRFRFLHTFLLLGAAAVFSCISAQASFLRSGQIYLIAANSNELHEFVIQPGYNSINSFPLGNLPAGGLDALGFCKNDNFLYGIGKTNNHLYKIGQGGAAQDLGSAGLSNTMNYLAGDVSPDGRYLYSVGSLSGSDEHLARTDLQTAGLPTQFVSISPLVHLADIAFDPMSGVLYGYDKRAGNVVKIDPNSGVVSALQSMEPGNTLYGLYFDAFGDLYGVGSTLFGIVDGYYQLDKNTGKETRLATGPSSSIADMASCPYSVKMKSEVDPPLNLPCTEINYSYNISNASGEILSGLEFLHPFPPGFHLKEVLLNTFGVAIDTQSVPGSLRMQNVSLPPGLARLKVRMTVGDIPKGKYYSQARFKDLPPLYNLECLSDFTGQPGFDDSTAFTVNRFDADSLAFKWLICYGNALVLETAEYGNNIHWNTGSTVQNLTVDRGGLYSFVAGSTCENIVVKHEVTSAQCPFTISVKHSVKPDTSFACSDVVFRFLIDNDSGESRYNISLVDTLPPGFTFVDIVKNGFGGTPTQNTGSSVFCLKGMTLKNGKDTLDVRVHIGDIPPGKYRNRAKLFDIPELMGPIRLSDDPGTPKFDSSGILIQGALSDSVVYELFICKDQELLLDASSMGKNFLWDDGSVSPIKKVDEPGHYHLTLFDGCEPAQLYWDIFPGTALEINAIPTIQLHQGESVSLTPQIINQGDSLRIFWSDPPGNSLSCLDCSDPLATPLEKTLYGLKVENEMCSDSISVLVEVDQNRRIYAPNIFSPNDDNLNDAFFLQSPDPGFIKVMSIHDRWGNLLFQSTNAAIGDKNTYWDGWTQGRPALAGVYIWWAKIEFVDGRQQVFSGNVTLVR